jgi:four helix bundle protein
MINNRFEDLLVWQKSRIIVNECYKVFKNTKDFSFKDQILRAAVSIMNNIAEGFERKGDKEFRKFLFITKGSCGEVRSMLYLGLDLGYIDDKIFEDIYNKSEEISRMLSGLINKMIT